MSNEKRLIPMVDYVIELNDNPVIFPATALLKIVERAKLLNQPPELGQFVRCNEKGEVVHKPYVSDYNHIDSDIREFAPLMEEYDSAQERVIFKGFEVHKNQGTVIIACTVHLSIRFIEDVGVAYFTDGHWKDIKTLNDITHLRLEMK